MGIVLLFQHPAHIVKGHGVGWILFEGRTELLLRRVVSLQSEQVATLLKQRAHCRGFFPEGGTSFSTVISLLPEPLNNSRLAVSTSCRARSSMVVTGQISHSRFLRAIQTVLPTG